METPRHIGRDACGESQEAEHLETYLPDLAAQAKRRKGFCPS